MKPELLTTHCSLSTQKNLLAFSAGIDSSALFFLLIENNIKFDIAIVDYGLRKQSKEEILHAKALAKQYNLTCHTATAPNFTSHFEQQARAFRYDFFEHLIREHSYDNLLTAHQLNDRLEWMLMRLAKGAGVVEMTGMEAVTQKKGYTLLRPLLDYSKDELLSYLEKNNHPYFVDESNSNEHYERNSFRKHFSDPLIAKYKKGIKRSFDYLETDREQLLSGYETVFHEKELHILRIYDSKVKIRAADRTLKQLGYLLSASQRQEIAVSDSLVIGRTWAVAYQEELLYIAPYLTTDMPKDFKELCRINKIPSKIRPYLFKVQIDPETIRRCVLFGEESTVNSE